MHTQSRGAACPPEVVKLSRLSGGAGRANAVFFPRIEVDINGGASWEGTTGLLTVLIECLTVLLEPFRFLWKHNQHLGSVRPTLKCVLSINYL